MKYITFTKNETKVIIFTVSILLGGFGVKYYKHFAVNGSLKAFDFSKDDSVFLDRSAGTEKNKTSFIPGHTSSDDSAHKNQAYTKDDTSYFRNEILNINLATKEELIDLPGVGEATAEKIIKYREQNKGFKKIDELMKVKGIGKKKFDNIKNFIKV
ncbi:MAG: ComEA family DNA-binding protein [Ignavibacteria bacterium]